VTFTGHADRVLSAGRSSDDLRMCAIGARSGDASGEPGIVFELVCATDLFAE
jgi:hypothetical protein